MAAGTAGVKRFDSLAWGVGMGVAAPLLTLAIMLWVIYVRADEGQFLRILLQEGTPGRILSLATLTGAALFFVAAYTNRLRAARGLLGSTIVYAMLAMGLAMAI